MKIQITLVSKKAMQLNFTLQNMAFGRVFLPFKPIVAGKPIFQTQYWATIWKYLTKVPKNKRPLVIKIEPKNYLLPKTSVTNYESWDWIF